MQVTFVNRKLHHLLPETILQEIFVPQVDFVKLVHENLRVALQEDTIPMQVVEIWRRVYYVHQGNIAVVE
jgi:hypothetical protein